MIETELTDVVGFLGILSRGSSVEDDTADIGNSLTSATYMSGLVKDKPKENSQITAEAELLSPTTSPIREDENDDERCYEAAVQQAWDEFLMPPPLRLVSNQ